jgi:quinol monooxygenase YgiN
MLARFVPRDGCEAALLAELTAMVGPSLEEAGCVEYRPLTDPARPGVVVMVQRWRDQDALDEHFASAHFARVAPRLAEMLAEPIEIVELVPRNPDEPPAHVAPEELRSLAST